MPIALSTKNTFPIWLAGDGAEPMETRPVFICRHITVAERCMIPERVNAIAQIADYAQAHAALGVMLREFITGWKNMIGRDGQAIPFDGNFIAILTGTESFELAGLIANRSGPDETEKKSSPSCSSSAQGISVQTAESEPAAVTSGQP